MWRIDEKEIGFLHGAYYEGYEMAEIIVHCVETNGKECRQLERVRHVGSTVVVSFECPFGVSF